MTNSSFIQKSPLLDVFFRAPGARPWSVTACMIVAGVLDMLGMGAILPIVGQFGGESVASNSKLNEVVLEVLGVIGLSPTLTNLMLFIAVLLTAKSLIGLAAMSYVASSVAAVQAGIRRTLLRSVMRARWEYFLDLRPGRISNSISGQSLHAGEAYYSSAMVVVSSIQAIALMIAATLVSGYMVIVTGIAALIVSLPLYKLIMLARAAGKKQWERASLLGSKVQDALGNMKAIKAMERGGTFSRLFESLIGEMRQAYFAVIFSRHALSYGQDIMIALTVTGGFYIGSKFMAMPLSDMLVLGIIYYQVITLVKKVQEHLQQASIMQAAYYSLQGMIETAQSNEEPEPTGKRVRLKDKIVLKNVCFSYKKRQVLKYINIEIPAGSITVLLGPSGAGKTTVIDVISGLLQPQKGLVLIDGVAIHKIDLSNWRRSIGYVPQELTLLHGSVYDNVTLGDDSIPRSDVWDALKSAGADAFVEALPKKLDTNIGNMGSKLSGGQRQRLSIARALVHKPRLLVFDEVTSALDEGTELEICRNIAELGKNYTIIAITHRPAWKRIATNLYTVSAGKARKYRLRRSSERSQSLTDAR